MRIERLDWVAAAVFGLVAAGGLWLWASEGRVVWLAKFAIMCGFG